MRQGGQGEGTATDLVGRVDDSVDLEVPWVAAPDVDPGVDLLVDGEARGAAAAARCVASEWVGEGEVGRGLGSALRGRRLVGRGEEALVRVAPPRHLVERHGRLHAGRHGRRRSRRARLLHRMGKRRWAEGGRERIAGRKEVRPQAVNRWTLHRTDWDPSPVGGV
jgi:hypothetical protein